MKKLLFGGVALAGAITLVGCGSDEVQQNDVELVTQVSAPVEIEWWHSMSGAFDETIKGIVENFNETIGEEKGIHVTAVYQGGYEDLKSKVTASLKAGNAPEVVQATGNHVIEYMQSGAVQDLTPYIFNEEIGIKDFEDIYEVYRLENSNYGNADTYYSLPFNKSTDLLFYNADLFKENGLGVPTTWDELVEVSKQITAITGKPALSIDNLANFLITALQQYGAGYTNKNGDILFNNETAVKIIEDLKANYDAGIWRLAGEDMYSSAPFLAENVAMYLGSSAGEGFLNRDNFDWETAQIPQVDVNNPKYIQQGSNVAILNQNKTSDEVYGAYEFVKYLCSYETNLEWALNTGYLPIRESVANSAEYQEFINNAQGGVKANGTAGAPYGFVEANFIKDSGVSSNLVRTEIGVMLEEILLNDADIQTTLDHYEAKLQ